jgi:pimeloyl-ACP methyl ester carboxylesterase
MRGGISRRQFLQTASASAAAVSLAGCMGDENDTEPDTDDTDSSTGDDGDETGGDPSAAVPESFDDRDELRQHTREYIQLLADGQFETAGEWVDPDAPIPFGATELEQAWTGVVGTNAELDAIQRVVYFGTVRGNNRYIVEIAVAGDQYQVLVDYSADGLISFQVTPIQEWTSPEYVDRDSFAEEEIRLETPLDCELGATVSLPDTDEQVPGVVIVHGNGPADRDNVIGPNRTYKELAWGLASQGIAVLRYDKRTYACQPDLADATIDDIVTEDALTAISELRSFEQVADDQLFVAGHSFGGGLAPRIARMDGNLAGTVMLAPGPAGPFSDLIERQAEHIYDSQSVNSSLREEFLQSVEQEAEKIRNLDIGDDEIVRFGGREFYESLQNYDQTGAAADLEIPQLLIQGGQDFQLTVEDDLPIWRDALEGNDNAEITVYDDLNHLFQESQGERTQAEYVLDEEVDQRVIDRIASFVETETAEESYGVRTLLA